MSGKFTGVRPAAGSGASAGAPRFKYSYKVLAVRLHGSFWATYDDGEGHTFTGYERITVRGVARGANSKLENPCARGHCAFFDKGRLTLQSPPSRQLAPINGWLQTSRFNRSYKITAKETVPDGEGVRTIDCSETDEDSESFVGSMQLSGPKTVVTSWVVPGLPLSCVPFGGDVSVPYSDNSPGYQSRFQFSDIYPLRAFRKRRVELEVEMNHSWRPNWATEAETRWDGWVELERVTGGKGKR